MYQPFAALLEEEAAVAQTKAETAGATVSEKDLPSLATALERYIYTTTTWPRPNCSQRLTCVRPLTLIVTESW